MENIKHEIIIRYLQGDPTEEEKRIFLSWVNASPDNKKAYFELKAIFDAAKVEAAPIDIGASWRRLAAKRERSVCRRTLTFRRAISYAAVITLTLTISIFITRRGHEPDTIQSRYVSGDGNTSNNVILPDGTTVHLGPHTTFYCESGFGRDNRKVYLEGEALFEVSHDKQLPFVVCSGDNQVEVLGTTFNVSAFRSDSLFITTLVEGSVKINMPERVSVLLSPDEQFVLNLNSGSSSVSSVDASRIAGWTKGYYSFEQQTLDDILHRLGNVYGVDFILKFTAKASSATYSGTFVRNQDISEIMDIINMSIPIRYKVEGNTITVSDI